MGRPKYTLPTPKLTGNKRGPKWVIRPMADHPDGTRKEVTRYSTAGVDTMKQALRWRDEVCAKLNNRVEAIQAQTPFADIVKAYQESYIPSLKPNTRLAYGVEIKHRILPQFAKLRLYEIQPIKVQQWVNWMDQKGWQTATMKQAVAVFRSIWEVASDWGYTRERCPATRRLRIPDKPVEQRRAPLLEEFTAVRAKVRPSLVLAFDLCAFCGLRVGEVAALRRKHLDYRAGTIRIEESISGDGARTSVKSKSGLIPMGFLRTALLEKCRMDALPEELVFTETRSAIREHIRLSFIRAGVKMPGIGAHSLRRFYATHASKFMSLASTQDVMRHSSPEMTQHYITETIGEKEAAMDRMKDKFLFGTISGENAKTRAN